MRADELCGHQESCGICAVSASDAIPDLMAHLEVQVCPVGAVRVADLAELLTAPQGIARLHEHGVEVRIERLDQARLLGRADVVLHPHDIAPALAIVEGIGHDPDRRRIDRVALVGISAADAIPILAKMVIDLKTLGVVVFFGIGRPHGEVKAIGRWRHCRIAANR